MPFIINILHTTYPFIGAQDKPFFDDGGLMRQNPNNPILADELRFWVAVSRSCGEAPRFT